jgi:hypothetical protein
MFGEQSMSDVSNDTVVATGGSSARTLATRAADVVNVKDFGAALHYETDDTTAINNAYSYLETICPNGGYLTFPQGGSRNVTSDPSHSGKNIWLLNGEVYGNTTTIVNGAGQDMFKTIAGGEFWGRNFTNTSFSPILRMDDSQTSTYTPTTDGVTDSTSTISGTTMTVNAMVSGTISVNDVLSGTSVTTGTTVVNQITGTTPGGTGTYQVSKSQTVSATTITATLPGVVANSLLINTTISSAVSGYSVYPISVVMTSNASGGAHAGISSYAKRKVVGSAVWSFLGQTQDYTGLTSLSSGPMIGIEQDMNASLADNGGAALGLCPSGSGVRVGFDLVCVAADKTVSGNEFGYGIRIGAARPPVNADGNPTAGPWIQQAYLKRGYTLWGTFSVGGFDTTMATALTGSNAPAFVMSAGQTFGLDGVAAATQAAPVHDFAWNTGTSQFQLRKNQTAYFSVSDAGFIKAASLDSTPFGLNTPSSVAATTLSATGVVSGAGFTTFFASPPAIGATTPGAVTSSQFTGPIGGVTAHSGVFTNVSANFCAATVTGGEIAYSVHGSGAVGFDSSAATLTGPALRFAAGQTLAWETTGAITSTYNASIPAVQFSNGSTVDLNIATSGGASWFSGSVGVGGSSGPNWSSGTGAPTYTASRGSMFSRTDGGVGSTLYVSQGSGVWNAVAGV